jgi:methylglyoxal reductase
MKMQRLGSQGPQISVVGYGAWEIGGGWGTNPADDEMIAAMHAAFDAGVNWVDTAEVYGKARRSEEVVGRALADHPDVMLFTKVAPAPNGSGFTPEGVRAGAELSLKTTGRSVIDLFQLHWRDKDIPVEETWGAMAQLVEDGLVRYIGVSNFDVALLERCKAVRHVDSLQPQFSALVREAADEVLPWCAENGTGSICYGPLAYGLLTGTIDATTTFEENDWRSGKGGMSYYTRLFAPDVIDGHLEVVSALRVIADGLGMGLPELALAWVFHQRGVTGAIAGSRRAAHTVQNARAGDVTLDQATLDEIAAVLR